MLGANLSRPMYQQSAPLPSMLHEFNSDSQSDRQTVRQRDRGTETSDVGTARTRARQKTHIAETRKESTFEVPAWSRNMAQG
jgi:hypothetical protein